MAHTLTYTNTTEYTIWYSTKENRLMQRNCALSGYRKMYCGNIRSVIKGYQ